MDRKKAAVYISFFTVVLLLVFFTVFLSYNDSSKDIRANLDKYETSLKNVEQMENTMYNQSQIITHTLFDMDSPNSTAFQSYASEFNKYCRSEYDRTSTVEEINYVFLINQNYSYFLDGYSELQRFDLDDPDQRTDCYMYYRLTLSPQISSVSSSVQAYKEYLNSAINLTMNKYASNSNRYVVLFAVLFFLLCISLYVFSRIVLRKQLTPLYSLIEEQKKFERDKSNFFSTISHEFKTPLTSIVMGSDLLLNPIMGELNEDQEQLVSTIKEDSFVLTNLVNNLLQLSRIETSDVVYNFELFDIKDIAEQITDQYSNKAQNMGINLTLQCPDNLPPINADAEKISWVISNLLSNAFKYSKQGDSITVTIMQDDQDRINVSVSDQGIGIPQEYSEKIFEKYFQVTDGDRELGGTGLGLAIAKDIINAHGGEIWYTPNRPNGSVFTFFIPLLKQMSLI